MTATYYRANGEALPGLPDTPDARKKYLARGLSLTPPGTPEPAAEPFVLPPKPSQVKAKAHKKEDK